MWGQDSLERAVRAGGIGVDPVWLDAVGSTNDEARWLASQGAPGWTVVAAGHQTAGRGRLGRSWTDVPGTSLLFSVVLRPAGPSESAPLLGLLAAAEMVAASADPRVRAKWPNDLLMGDRKVGGILAEAAVAQGQVEHVVIGVGMNIATREAEFPPEIRSSATSLGIERVPMDPETLLTGFLLRLRAHADLTPPEVIELYRVACSTLGRRVRVATTSAELREGTAVGLDPLGGLVIERDGRRETVTSGEVVHLR